ncbi:MAG TPA: DJ-1/PfpI family protein [Magnetospirillaceae bacterium]|jgi:putative intracellular protease/amidase
MAEAAGSVVFAIFPLVTQLDFTGPYQVLARLPGYRVILASLEGGPIKSGEGLLFGETVPISTIKACDILCVPGGPGTDAVMEDAAYLTEIKRLAATATWITSVCTGSLILGAAGLLKDKHAACHWASRDLLTAFGAIPDASRVVQDGNIVTGGGVTAGIDFALTLAAEIAGEEIAQAIQLGIEYAPAPPFASGRVELAPSSVRTLVNQAGAKMMQDRKEAVARAAARLNAPSEPAKVEIIKSWKALG